ncbi:hypothetical protein FB45DRAFT_1075748 [Roridomyces roridus]|uniref:F-box domain-containing protein n=1 Tax=Roridomyces roridus TaxID=1738132 RepID=A0AAD7CI94_9AGAR|nr:hypothetical protein FB45DRAFT_1075748 [Roridomyces roridus]
MCFHGAHAHPGTQNTPTYSYTPSTVFGLRAVSSVNRRRCTWYLPGSSDVQGRAGPESPGLGWALTGLGSAFPKPEPEPASSPAQALSPGLSLGLVQVRFVLRELPEVWFARSHAGTRPKPRIRADWRIWSVDFLSRTSTLTQSFFRTRWVQDSNMHCDSSCSTHCLYRPLNLSSPSEDLVSSNDAPSSLQAAEFCSAIERARKDLARVQDALAILTAQRTELEDFIRENESVVSLLRQLPNEMLSEIFLRCVDVAAPFDPVHNDAWVLARVCQRWRSVAVTTSQLWCHFVLPEPDRGRRTNVPRPIPHRLWETQLERAHFAPLSIRLVDHVPADLLDMFFAVAHQWKEIIFINTGHFTRFVDLGIEFPVLTKIVAGDFMYSGPLLPSDLPGADLVKALPALKEVILSLGSDPFPAQHRLPWSQLRTCNLSNFRISHILEALPLLSPGSHLTLRAPAVGDGDLNPIVTNMHFLEIVGGTSRARGDLLNVLTAPHLQNLLLTHRKGEYTPPDAITTFLTNSRCCLSRQLLDILRLPAVCRVLRLEIGYLPDREWGPFLAGLEQVEPRLVPDLRTLVLREDSGSWNISQRLANRNPVRRTRSLEAILVELQALDPRCVRLFVVRFLCTLLVLVLIPLIQFLLRFCDPDKIRPIGNTDVDSHSVGHKTLKNGTIMTIQQKPIRLTHWCLDEPTAQARVSQTRANKTELCHNSKWSRNFAS